MNIVLGIMVALAVILDFLALFEFGHRNIQATFWYLLAATICTGIAAGMAYGGRA